MILTLRLLSRSRCLRTMAMLAWLMLASTSLIAAPASMGMAAMHSGHAVASADAGQHQGMDKLQHSTHGMHGAPDRSCCGDHPSQGCDCHSVCGSALLSVSPVVALSASPATSYALPSRIRAPSMDAAPPLRPPSA